ncbi:NTP pyrophosphohydrolase [Actinocrispum sp. NPDC049592]|uniref:NTP pyrophosphohydrolase n=1 Tax=Actinocrispum sp. NPDC049592 TaxID=3154835 RepID=UPI003422F964
MIPLVIIDAANVVGSVPDGWWRDRAGATERLRDSLAALPSTGVGGLEPPIDVVMVVEGKARDVAPSPTIRVVPATGSGDDTIVDLVREESGSRSCVVVTADRGLRSRVTDLGASVLGPSSVR